MAAISKKYWIFFLSWPSFPPLPSYLPFANTFILYKNVYTEYDKLLSYVELLISKSIKHRQWTNERNT